MNNSPFISVVIATFNAVATLDRCLESVFNQTYYNYEVILIDGGSTDGTLGVVEKFVKKISYWESEPDRGIYHAWNKALKHASGEWICFLGADDYFISSSALVKMGESLAVAFPNYRVVYGKIALVNRRDEELDIVGKPWEQACRTFSDHLSIPHPGLFHHRSLFEDFGGFDENFQLAGDYDFLCRELPKGKALFVDEVVVAMQFGGISSDPKSSMLYSREVWLVHKKQGRKVPHLHWWFTSGKLYLRFFLWRVLGPDKAAFFFDRVRSLRGKPPLWKNM